MCDIEKKLQFYKEINEKLRTIEAEIYESNWNFHCETCGDGQLIIHSIRLFPNEILMYCKNCSSAVKISKKAKTKIKNYIRNKLGVKDNFEFNFIVDINEKKII